MTEYETALDYIRARDVARVFGHCDLPIPDNLVAAIIEYERQLAVYREHKRLVDFVDRTKNWG